MKSLKSFRERAGFASQTALAKFLDINPANISGWESGNGFPSYQILKRLLEMGATVEELFGIPYKSLTETHSKVNFSDAELADFVKRGLKFLFSREKEL
jgi:transcriptional regulator with XRE-family HTH domain